MSQVDHTPRPFKTFKQAICKTNNREAFLEKAAQAEWPSRGRAVDSDGGHVSMLAYQEAKKRLLSRN